MGLQHRGYLLTAYGLPHMMGYLPTKDGQPNPAALSVLDLMDRAVELGLAGIEIPLTAKVPSFNGVIVELPPLPNDLPAELRRRNLSLIADYGALLDYDVEHTRSYLELAARSGATLVRAILSHLLCGDRRPLKQSGGWKAHREALAARLNEILPYAADLGVTLALENHQDASTEDFWWLYEQTKESPAFGITLDTGNPLAVGQDPVATTRELAPLIRHLHLKDYTLHFAPEGYRLVRCAAGDGVIDFPAILDILCGEGSPFNRWGASMLPGIEIAAQQTRTVPLLDPGWWVDHSPRSATDLVPVLELVWRQARPEAQPYSSAWERGEDSATVCAEEWNTLMRSAQYFRTNF